MQNGPRVLIVEDHEPTRETLSLLFEKEGFLANGAATCADARRSFAAHRPDVALVDIGLPDGDGLDLVAQFAAEDPHARIIVVTARDEQGLAKEAARRGAFSFVHKPYGFQDVLAVVKDALGSA